MFYWPECHPEKIIITILHLVVLYPVILISSCNNTSHSHFELKINLKLEFMQISIVYVVVSVVWSVSWISPTHICLSQK